MVCLQGKCACFYGTSTGLSGRLSVSASTVRRGKGASLQVSVDWKSEGGEDASVSSLFCDSEGTALFTAKERGGATISRVKAADGMEAKAYAGLEDEAGAVGQVEVLTDDKWAYLSCGKKVVLYGFAKEKAVSTLVGDGIKYQIKKLPRSLAVCFYSLINDAVCTYISNI